MKKTATSLLALFLSFLLGSAYAQGVQHTVNISNDQFTPSTLSIAQGDIVRWVLVNGIHTVTSTTGEWTEAMLSTPGEEFMHTFNTAGTFPYECRLHAGMTGTITVTGTTAAPGLQAMPSLLQVYPNPAQHQLSVSSAIAGTHQLNVWNTLGQLVLTEIVNPVAEDNWFQVNVAHLPAGSYLIVLQNADRMVARNRFLKVD